MNTLKLKIKIILKNYLGISNLEHTLNTSKLIIMNDTKLSYEKRIIVIENSINMLTNYLNELREDLHNKREDLRDV